MLLRHRHRHRHRRVARLRIQHGTARRATQLTSESQTPVTIPTALSEPDAMKSVTVGGAEGPWAEAQPSREVMTLGALSLLRPHSELGVYAGALVRRHLGSQVRTERQARASTNDRRWKRQFSPPQRAEKAGRNPWT